MIVLLYDGSFAGLLTAIFETYERKLSNVSIHRVQIYQRGIFDENKTVVTDVEKAKRIWSGMKRKLSNHARREFYYTFLSTLPGMEDTLLQYIKYVFSKEENVERNFSFDAVNYVSQTAHQVHREKHRMEAFVRFTRLEDDLYCSFVSPDFNVLPIIAPHFQDRYADQHWLIYDRKRDYGICHDPTTHLVTDVMLDNPQQEEIPTSVVHEEEEGYQSLWRTYFEHVNISERKNLKLHIRHIPKRYWADLTEKF
jgi:probable DNA metabolism protein